MNDLATMPAIPNRAVSNTALLTLGATFLGVFPTNLGSVLLLLLLIVALRQQPALMMQRPAWIYGVALFLLLRCFAVIASPEPLVSFRHVSKDWHLLLLLPGAFGLLMDASAWARRIVLAILLLTLLVASAQFADLVPALLGDMVQRSAVSASQTGAFQKLTLTLGGTAMLALFAGRMFGFRHRQQALYIGMLVLLLLISGARSAWLGVLVGGLVYAIGRRLSLRHITLGLVLVVVVTIALPATRTRIQQTVRQVNQMEINYGSLARRQQLWAGAWQMGNSALFGVGPGRFRQASHDVVPGKGSRAHAHNMPLHILAESGWPGLLGWLAMIASFAVPLFRRLQAVPACAAALTAMLGAGLFEVNQYDAEVATLFYLLIGVGLFRAGAGLRRFDGPRRLDGQ